MQKLVSFLTLQKRIETVLDCPGSMCRHCIEVLTGEIPPETTFEIYRTAHPVSEKAAAKMGRGEP